MRKQLLAMTLASGLAGSPPSALAADLGEAIDRVASAWEDDGLFEGVVLVARADRPIFHRAYGLASHELSVQNTPETVFCIASVTKTLTAILLIQMIAEGKLELSDTVDRWLPEFPGADRVTIEQLVAHRSGVPHRVTEPGDEIERIDPADIVERVNERGLLFEPGSSRRYSSAGYSCLARIIELVDLESYATVLQRRIFEPAGMTSSFHVDHRAIIPQRAASYEYGAVGPRNTTPKDYSHLAGAGSIFSTTGDLHAMLVALRAGLLGEKTWVELTTNWYGSSWRGSTNGYQCRVDVLPELDAWLIITSNLRTGAVDELRTVIRTALSGEQVVAPFRSRPATGTSAVELDRLVGDYERQGGVIRVRKQEGDLFCDGGILVRQEDGTFFYPQRFGILRFVPGDEGRISHIEWFEQGQTFVNPRMED